MCGQPAVAALISLSGFFRFVYLTFARGTGPPCRRASRIQNNKNSISEKKKQSSNNNIKNDLATSTLLLLAHKNFYVFNLEFCYCFYQSRA